MLAVWLETPWGLERAATWANQLVVWSAPAWAEESDLERAGEWVRLWAALLGMTWDCETAVTLDHGWAAWRAPAWADWWVLGLAPELERQWVVESAVTWAERLEKQWALGLAQPWAMECWLVLELVSGTSHAKRTARFDCLQRRRCCSCAVRFAPTLLECQSWQTCLW